MKPNAGRNAGGLTGSRIRWYGRRDDSMKSAVHARHHCRIRRTAGCVLSKDEALVKRSDTVRNVFVKDPNGLNLELVGAADPNL